MSTKQRCWVPGILFLPLAILAIAVSPRLTHAQADTRSYHIPIWWEIRPPNPCDGDNVRLVFFACGPCIDLVNARPIVDQRGSILVEAKSNREQCQIEICTIDSVGIDLGAFRAGTHQLGFLTQTEVTQADSSVCYVNRDGIAQFTVGSCGPGRGPLPYVDDIVVGQRVVCVRDPCPDLACPHDLIPVSISGSFPNDCFILRRIEMVPNDSTSGVPKVRILVDDLGCLDRVCNPGFFAWSGNVSLPPLFPGNYNLQVELGKSTCSDSFPDSVYSTLIDFLVVPQCSIPSPTCFQTYWGGDEPHNECDAVVRPGHPGRVHLELAPRVALAGVQGELAIGNRLRITNVEPIGYASGMHLTWRPTEYGARFVMFADEGAPIPPYTRRDLNGWPVVRITVEPIPGVPIPERANLFANNLLASDSSGGAVHGCPVPHRELNAATICGGSRCDVNVDGNADVRDLVLMVHCVMHGTDCPDSGAVDLDCDGNGTVALEDVLCCARFMLNGGIPDSIGGRPEPGVRVEFGAVRRTENEMVVPLTLRGAYKVGAARLALRYPSDRFDVTGVSLAQTKDWLELHETRDGKLVIGLIGMAGEVAGNGVIDMEVRLALKSGQSSGGEVRVVESDFSGPDGVGLEVDLGKPGSALPTTAAVSLTRGQPNPFSGTTRFAVAIATAGMLDVAVHDLSGRRVKSLVRAHVAAGSRDLAWDGRDESGRLAASGVYFIRASVAGSTVSNRLVLLREQ